MLQDIRSSIQGTMAKVIIGLIVISFSIFGIESILLGGGSSGVAEVNGEDISPFEVQQAVNTQKRQLIAMMGESIDPAMLDDDLLSARAIEGIINRRLLMQAAASMDLTVSDREIGTVIAGMEQFQLDGQFSPEVYKSLLSSAGYTPLSFKKGLMEDLVANQQRSGLAGSDFATPAELALNARISAEERDVRYLTIPVERYRQDREVSEAEIEQWYESNADAYQTEESVVLEYIELLVDDFREPVAEEVLRQEFELAREQYQYQTENRVSHILFEQGSDESDDAYQARIEAARGQLAQGRDFGELAGEVSDDIGSASSGGDLGFSAGDAFPQEMEQAIASLEPGQLSEPVTTDAGVHLILLTERRAGEEISFEQLRPELEQTIQLSEARAALLLAAESLGDYTFNAESLSGPAKELGMEVLVSDPVGRNQGEGLFSNPALIAAAYSPEVLEQGLNSEVIELSQEHFVALRVRQHNKPELRPLAAVRDDIVTAITEQYARESVAAEAARAVAALRAGQGVEAFALENDYEWQVEIGAQRRNPNLPPEVLRRAFALPAPEGNGVGQVDYVMSGVGDAMVIELARVSEGKLENLSAPQLSVLERQVGAEFGTLVQQEFQSGLREQADITVL